MRSYVMSDAMADLVNGRILSQLDLDKVIDNKGVLVVGNYGTGKSHLMSIISAIAADAELLSEVQNPKFRDAAARIAGKFEVLRIEIGSTSMPLRTIITNNIERDLARRGISFAFPEVSQITNNKDALNDMMAAFAGKYGTRGYLIVVDELLDYLKSRRDSELMRDISFLREMGEFVRNSRFRFISGVQEALFDNPTFHNVSNSFLKMKDRYEQALIRSQDIAFVAKRRMLSKTPEQKALIRQHLEPFCRLYKGMAEQLEEYVDLFPIHPAYINTFQRMIIVEKRRSSGRSPIPSGRSSICRCPQTLRASSPTIPIGIASKATLQSAWSPRWRRCCRRAAFWRTSATAPLQSPPTNRWL